MNDRAKGTLYGLLGAALFGASAPIAKLLVSSTAPLALAALLYLGAAAGLTASRLVRRRSDEAQLRRSDIGLMAAISLIGGVVGPVLLLVGLHRLSAVAASLLLNLEAPFTILIAAWVFGEHLGRRAVTATAAILAGCFLLAYRPGDLHASWTGALAVAGACLCWGIDNNLMQRLSVRDPVAIVRWKALVAGSASLLLAIATGQTFPRPALMAGALGLGVLSYGLSIVLDVIALRLLGAVREAALFATAPFMGALVSIALGERPGLSTGGAMLLMAAGAWLLARERHAHVHTHEPLEHEHVHVHDEHHQHEHPAGIAPGVPHSHPHHHAPITHDHAHVPDLHHRHKH